MKGRRRNPFRFVIPVLLVALLGCGLKRAPQSGGDFSRATLRLEEDARTGADPAARAEAHLDLARLLLNPENPKRDYGKALGEFQAFLALAPSDWRAGEVQTWVAALRELAARVQETGLQRERVRRLERELKARVETQELQLKKNQELQLQGERLQARAESLEKLNRGLNEANRSLKEANEKLKETIEQLKDLDREIEEKRRSIR